MAKDPVCGIEITIFPDTPSAEHNKKPYYFCADVCKNKFLNNPELYVPQKSATTKKHNIVNTGKTDKDIRLFLGAICMALFLKTGGVPKALSAIFGLIFTLTSITGFCPLYKLLDINTCKKD